MKKKKKEEAKPVRKSQGQILQEALGLGPEDLPDVEKKLFIARFLDYFSEETLDFVYKDRSIESYKDEIIKFLEFVGTSREEDKLLKRSFENKEIMEIIYRLKKKAEELALNKGGMKKGVDKRLRKISLITTMPMFGVLIIFTIAFMFFDFFGSWINFFILIPILCVFCMVPQFVRGSVLRKWYQFKEENRNDFFTENREDIMIMKGYTGEILNNIRDKLLELKVPLQLIKFVLHSRDYENLKLINQQTVKGLPQFFFSFDYPPGMEPFPIPEILLKQQEVGRHAKPEQRPEKNFIVLTELEGKNGVLTNFLPSLKTSLADKINDMLNDCEFTRVPKVFKEIIPDSENQPIYCTCGEVAKITNIQICNWKNQFKFYLFESAECQCGEQIYVFSLLDDSTEVPEELTDIFSS